LARTTVCRVMLVCLAAFLLAGFGNSAKAADSMLVVTTDKALNDKWYRTKAQAAPVLVPTRTAFANQEVTVAVFYHTPGLDAASRARIVYDLKIVYPDGNFTENKDLTVVDDKLEAIKIVRMGAQTAKVAFATPGVYSIEVTVRDSVAKTVQTHKSALEVKDYSPAGYRVAEGGLNEWMMNYYRNPSPEKALDAVAAWTRQGPEARGRHFHEAAGFFGKVFSDNPFLIPFLLKSYNEQDRDARIMIMALFPYIKYDFSAFIAGLDEADRRFCAEWPQRCIPYPEEGIKDVASAKEAVLAGYQMDLLWNRFFAGGEYRPIKMIVDVLDWGRYKGSLERYKQTRTAAAEAAAAKDVAYQTARWSLGRFIRQHALVRDYCSFMLEKERLSPVARQELKALLDKN